VLKQVLTTLKVTPVFEAVNIPFVQQFLDADRKLRPDEVMTGRRPRCWTSGPGGSGAAATAGAGGSRAG
jgi:hypothetical protein